MIKDLEALLSLAKHRTMTRAADSLGVTQPSISKRIANLEEQLARKLIEKDGFRIALTPAALELIEKVRPHVAGLKSALDEEVVLSGGYVSLAVSEYIVMGWGAKVFTDLLKERPDLKIDFLEQSWMPAIEKVRSGETMLALCAGAPGRATDLAGMELCKDELVLVSRTKKMRIEPNSRIKALCVHSTSQTVLALKKTLKEYQSKWSFKIELIESFNSFGAIAKLAQYGYENAIVPRALAESVGIPNSRIVEFPRPGVSVPVSIFTRKTSLQVPSVREIIHELENRVALL